LVEVWLNILEDAGDISITQDMKEYIETLRSELKGKKRIHHKFRRVKIELEEVSPDYKFVTVYGRKNELIGKYWVLYDGLFVNDAILIDNKDLERIKMEFNEETRNVPQEQPEVPTEEPSVPQEQLPIHNEQVLSDFLTCNNINEFEVRVKDRSVELPEIVLETNEEGVIFVEYEFNGRARKAFIQTDINSGTVKIRPVFNDERKAWFFEVLYVDRTITLGIETDCVKKGLNPFFMFRKSGASERQEWAHNLVPRSEDFSGSINIAVKRKTMNFLQGKYVFYKKKDESMSASIGLKDYSEKLLDDHKGVPSLMDRRILIRMQEVDPKRKFIELIGKDNKVIARYWVVNQTPQFGTMPLIDNDEYAEFMRELNVSEEVIKSGLIKKPQTQEDPHETEEKPKGQIDLPFKEQKKPFDKISEEKKREYDELKATLPHGTYALDSLLSLSEEEDFSVLEQRLKNPNLTISNLDIKTDKNHTAFFSYNYKGLKRRAYIQTSDSKNIIISPEYDRTQNKWRFNVLDKNGEILFIINLDPECIEQGTNPFYNRDDVTPDIKTKWLDDQGPRPKTYKQKLTCSPTYKKGQPFFSGGFVFASWKEGLKVSSVESTFVRNIYNQIQGELTYNQQKEKYEISKEGKKQYNKLREVNIRLLEIGLENKLIEVLDKEGNRLGLYWLMKMGKLPSEYSKQKSLIRITSKADWEEYNEIVQAFHEDREPNIKKVVKKPESTPDTPADVPDKPYASSDKKNNKKKNPGTKKGVKSPSKPDGSGKKKPRKIWKGFNERWIQWGRGFPTKGKKKKRFKRDESLREIIVDPIYSLGEAVEKIEASHRKEEPIKRVFLDLDDVLIRPKGFIASDAWVRQTIDRYGGGSAAIRKALKEWREHEERMLEAIFFETVEPDTKKCLKKMRDLGVEIVIVTARKEEDYQRTVAILERLNIGLKIGEDIQLICTQGSGMKKVYSIDNYITQNGDVNSLFIDDNPHTVATVAEYASKKSKQTIQSFCYRNTRDYENIDVGEYKRLAEEAEDIRNLENAMEYYLNAQEYYLNLLEYSVKIPEDQRLFLYSNISKKIVELEERGVEVSALKKSFLPKMTGCLKFVQKSNYEFLDKEHIKHFEDTLYRYFSFYFVNHITFRNIYERWREKGLSVGESLKKIIPVTRPSAKNMKRFQEYEIVINEENMYPFLEPLLEYIVEEVPDVVYVIDTGARPFLELVQYFVKECGLSKRIEVVPIAISHKNLGDTEIEIDQLFQSVKNADEEGQIKSEGRGGRKLNAQERKYIKELKKTFPLRGKKFLLVDDNKNSGGTYMLFRNVAGRYGVAESDVMMGTPVSFSSDNIAEDLIVTTMKMYGEYDWYRRPPAPPMGIWEQEEDECLRGVERSERYGPFLSKPLEGKDAQRTRTFKMLSKSNFARDIKIYADELLQKGRKVSIELAEKEKQYLITEDNLFSILSENEDELFVILKERSISCIEVLETTAWMLGEQTLRTVFSDKDIITKIFYEMDIHPDSELIVNTQSKLLAELNRWQGIFDELLTRKEEITNGAPPDLDVPIDRAIFF